MNMQILQWLLRHRDVLLKVVEIAKRFPKNGTYAAKWAVINEIAVLVIPVFEAEMAKPKALAEEYYSLAAAEAEYTALAIDWQLIIDVLVPLLINILQLLTEKK